MPRGEWFLNIPAAQNLNLMNPQQDRDRRDEDSISDRNIDVTRSERRQAVANENDNPSREGGSMGDGGSETGSRPSDSTRDNAFSSGTTGSVNDDQTGSHVEGQYPKQGESGPGQPQGQVGKPGDQPE
jgi:hypothetical protein